MKVYLIEPFCIGKEHIINNITFLESFFDDERVSDVKFFSDKKHGEEVLGLLDITTKTEKKIEFISIRIDRSNYFKRVLNEFINTCRVFFLSEKNTVLLFLSINETSQLIVKLLNVIFKRKIVLIPHAILTTLNENVSSGRYAWLKKILCFEFWIGKLNSKKIKYLILGKHIEVKMKAMNKLDGVNYLVIPLPYLYDEGVDNFRQCSNKLTISFIGVGSKDKNIEKFYQLAAKYEGVIQFKHLGVLASDCTLLPEKYGLNISYDSMIPYETLKEGIINSDYIYMNLERKSYELRASATFFDCINLGKPLIIDRDSFYYDSELINESHDIGIKLSFHEDLCEALEGVSSDDYYNMQVNIYELKNKILGFNYCEAVIND
ncbi:hypothetical protein [Vibrio campbellii]|uniref:Glycosyltransferase family 1 protein n=3 Tax=Vibrio campbellii TaxID=680 RepID=A7MSL1_VIBC1|nr:hypothetical protein [Vibrio campbellii]ABU69694.1 hypothetical protein VIBHAR_00692 [Vibrio campbellii ATCC BAA-1116]AGU96587.1 hypothetical protein M892_09385 [Vibrio campbellii ATCC BAA-1116]MBT0120107.1 hypothetical protein [Vibrio campbellii]MBT0135018.1 hypothetical protein [Vibrio campbellii]MBT0139698.1 hypothetical protein [Vibrio campbellii]